ncbi:stage II sporulation protein D [Pseudoflavonifractor phocaeensis]|nr:stage II sporulation protein D [Pseudoflavonifractor phocaeensis]
MKQVVATALALLLVLFLLPLLLFGTGGLEQTEQAAPTGELPIDRTVVTPSPSADSQTQIRVALTDGSVLTLGLDQYLWRVVAAEMPASFELEALKAQAAAARTYTLSKLGRTVEKHPDADVCTDITCCQAYIDPDQAAANWGDNAAAYTAKITSAVSETDGMAVLYDGQPIQAVFFSSAAGRTVDAVEVWGNSVPYLTGVDSPEGDEVPNYHSTVTFTLEEFKSKLLAQYPDADLSGDPAGWFQNTVPNSAGGVEQVDVGGVTVSGGALRTLLGLRSTSFTVTADSQGVTFSVTGYGHGVGMSQYGANALARQGKTYDEILKWYYTGVEVAPYTPGG